MDVKVAAVKAYNWTVSSHRKNEKKQTKKKNI